MPKVEHPALKLLALIRHWMQFQFNTFPRIGEVPVALQWPNNVVEQLGDFSFLSP